MSVMVVYLPTFLSVNSFCFPVLQPCAKVLCAKSIVCPLVYCGEVVRIRFIIVEFGHPLYTAQYH